MMQRQLVRGRIAFQTEGRLLQELGERLVASPQVALVELIKNSYDADATRCQVTLDRNKGALIVNDDGQGMTLDQFETRWMRIATSNKVDKRTSPRFHRNLTGQKGIGRFAVRSLGGLLLLESVARDRLRGCKTRLVAEFNWKELDDKSSLNEAEIPYQLFEVDDSQPIGTALTIGELSSDTDFATSPAFRTSVLNIITPLRALDGGRFSSFSNKPDRDPGFSVTLPGDSSASDNEIDLAEKVLSHAWARLKINLTGRSLKYSVRFNNRQKPVEFKATVSSKIKNGLIADIRFFPRRAGVFKDIGVDGRQAWSWVRERHGVAVIDRGFRVQPYGMEDDDWLRLDADSAHNERDWRSSISVEYFPIPGTQRLRSENPMLNLPSNFQLVGAVFIESAGSGSRADEDLVTAMDREGFLANGSFAQLSDFVRGGVEFLARADRLEMQREAARKAQEARRRLRADLQGAVKYIEKSSTLTRSDKSRLIEEYSNLAVRVDETEGYDQEARQKLEAMSALGVVSGFMTHETTRIVAGLKHSLEILERLARQHPSLRPDVETLQESYSALQRHLEYSRMFVDATQRGQVATFKVAPQVELVIEKFGGFARSRGIEVRCEVDPSVQVVGMSVAGYSGILLNLYTNALKAIIASHAVSPKAQIVFRARNEGARHIVEVLDTGVGIPPDLRRRVWDPLFTTTSRLNNPLGSGMGLGLPLIRQLVEQVGGRIEIVDAPAGFSTQVRAQFPIAHGKA